MLTPATWPGHAGRATSHTVASSRSTTADRITSCYANWPIGTFVQAASMHARRW